MNIIIGGGKHVNNIQEIMCYDLSTSCKGMTNEIGTKTCSYLTDLLFSELLLSDYVHVKKV